MQLARALVAALADGTQLVLGSSNPVRDVALAAAPRDGVVVRSNRGVAGIDGTVSTAMGAALAHDGPTVALLGDLTLLHDTTGLVVGPDEAAAGPHDRRARRPWWRHLPPAGAGRARARGRVRAGLRHPAHGRPGGAVRGDGRAPTATPNRPTSQGTSAARASGSSRCRRSRAGLRAAHAALRARVAAAVGA